MSEELEPKRDLEVLWTPAQVAKYLTVSLVTVYRYIHEGKVIDPTKIVRFSNRIRIPRSEVERIAGKTKEKLLGDNQE